MADVAEFDLIRHFFSGIGSGPHVVKGVGDDCAIIAPPPGCQLVVTTDTLVEGVHFPAACDARVLGRRALRVNLSDLAAMGADVLGIQLALTLPRADADWLAAFSAGLAADCEAFACPLLGGDTTRGPLTVTITALGTVPVGNALLRSGARPGDRLYVTGSLGDARGALEVMDEHGGGGGALAQRYWLPQPRLTAGVLLRGLASAALDISDGLAQDAGHIARASGVGCRIEVASLPVSAALAGIVDRDRALLWALTGGDDYELCFTVPPHNVPAVERALNDAGEAYARIGEMVVGEGVTCLDGEGQPMTVERGGYAHF
ncbi:MAG TPA: thiamine-phosphate kinase [Porticoccaceae bacterium]